jgi:hypothetical protein
MDADVSCIAINGLDQIVAGSGSWSTAGMPQFGTSIYMVQL